MRGGCHDKDEFLREKSKEITFQIFIFFLNEKKTKPMIENDEDTKFIVNNIFGGPFCFYFIKVLGPRICSYYV